MSAHQSRERALAGYYLTPASGSFPPARSHRPPTSSRSLPSSRQFLVEAPKQTLVVLMPTTILREFWPEHASHNLSKLSALSPSFGLCAITVHRVSDSPNFIPTLCQWGLNGNKRVRCHRSRDRAIWSMVRDERLRPVSKIGQAGSRVELYEGVCAFLAL